MPVPPAFISHQNRKSRSQLASHLRRREDIEGLGNFGLPAELVLAVDLGGDRELLAGVGRDAGAGDDGVRAHNLLVVVDVGGAVRAVVAVDGVACGCYS